MELDELLPARGAAAPPTYVIAPGEGRRPAAIICLRADCPARGRPSYHPTDLAELYCGGCHRYHATAGAWPERSRPLSVSELNVMERQCDECLFSAAALVTPERRQEILSQCRRDGTAFLCHKATLSGNLQVVCRGFAEREQTLVIVLGRALSLVREVREEDLLDIAARTRAMKGVVND